jgi:hypothetical protein
MTDTANLIARLQEYADEDADLGWNTNRARAHLDAKAAIERLSQQVAGYIEQHGRDSAELRRLCGERDEAKVKVAELEERIAALESELAELANQEPCGWQFRVRVIATGEWSQWEHANDTVRKLHKDKCKKDTEFRPVFAHPPAAAASEWKPIETAPKDGTPLILFARAKHATASAPVIGWYLESHGWIEAAYGPNEPVGLVPSYWMPRPEFPAIAAEKESKT